MGEIKRISQVSRLYRLISFCAEISKGKWLHLYNLAEKKIAWFIQQRDTSCKSYTICLAQSRNRETQRQNYPREGRLEGVEGEKGEEGEKVGGGGGHIVDWLPAGRVSCTSTYYPLHSTNPPLQICRPLIRPNMQ